MKAEVTEVQALVCTMSSGIRIWQGVDIVPPVPWWRQVRVDQVCKGVLLAVAGLNALILLGLLVTVTAANL